MKSDSEFTIPTRIVIKKSYFLGGGTTGEGDTQLIRLKKKEIYIEQIHS